jgi:hypothetical protein
MTRRLAFVNRARDLRTVWVRTSDASNLEDGVDDTTDTLAGNETSSDCETV